MAPEGSAQTAEQKRKPADFAQLLNVLLALRKKGGNDGTPAQRATWRRQRSALRKGASQQSETYAYPYVLPYIPQIKSPAQRTVAIQLAALFAEFDRIPIYEKQADKKMERRDFGTWCNLVSEGVARENGKTFELDPADPDIIAHRLTYLATLDAQQGIATVRRIMAIASGLSNPPAIDYWDLFATFMHWGKGFSEASTRVRNRPLASYYAAFRTKKPADDQSANSNN